MIGRVDEMDIAETRSRCLEMMLAFHHGEVDDGAPAHDRAVAGKAGLLFRDFVTGEWHALRFARWKPTTQTSGMVYINSQLLPAFGALRLHQITRQEVARWFDGYSRSHPGGANRAFEILHEMMGFAVSQGHITENPATGIIKNPRRVMTRFLGHDEVRLLLF